MIILTEISQKSTYKLSNIIITNLVIKDKNFIACNEYDYVEYIKYKDYYIIYVYHNILVCIIYVNNSCDFHKKDGPAWIEYFENGEIHYKRYYLNGEYYSYENYVLEIKKLV